MNRSELMEFCKEMDKEALSLMEKKNADYAGQKDDGDALYNMRFCEHLGICSAQTGCLVRMADKLARLATYNNRGDLKAKDESPRDTCLDLNNYTKFYAALDGEDKKEQAFEICPECGWVMKLETAGARRCTRPDCNYMEYETECKPGMHDWKKIPDTEPNCYQCKKCKVVIGKNKKKEDKPKGA